MAESGTRRSGDLIGRGVARQISLSREQVGRLSLLTCACHKGLERPTVAIDPATRMPAASKPRVIARPTPSAAPVAIATLCVSLMACFLPHYLPPSSFRFGGRALEIAS